MPATITLALSTAESTHRLGQCLGRSLPASTVLLLEGNLGSGKTTLIQGLGSGLEITDTVDSPTFTLINEYVSGRIPLYHVDLYRLDPPGIDGLYLETYWGGVEVEPGILAIEWADKLTYRPADGLQITLQYSEATGRVAHLQAIRSDHQALLKTLDSDAILAHEI
ncbi:MAG: tRNA (adenosine(37)-N6)-threonylcarbamoyltransferase complex ATPase subunit type 1 TsaE [Cyanobacteria bacterium J06659_2]